MLKPQRNSVVTMVIIVLSIVVLSFTGCTKPQEQKVIKIGVVGPLTGEGATYGDAMKRGVDLALDEINSAGGIAGKKIEAIYEDDKLSPKDGVNAFNKLSQFEKVPVVIGSASSSVSLAIAPVAEKNKVVLFSSISTADSLKDAGDFFFRNIPPNNIQATTAAYFIKNQLKLDKVVVFYQNSDYGVNMDKVFTQTFQSLAGSVVTHISYETGQADFKTSLFKIKEKNPGLVYIPGTYQENALIIKQAREIGLKSVFMSGDGAYSPQLLKIAGKTAEGFYITQMILPSKEKSSTLAKFYTSYETKYKQSPDVYSAYSYDAMKTIAKALSDCYAKQKGSACTGEDVKNALYKTEYEGVTGVTKFDNFGEPVDKFYSIYTVKNGDFVPVDWNPGK